MFGRSEQCEGGGVGGGQAECDRLVGWDDKHAWDKQGCWAGGGAAEVAHDGFDWAFDGEGDMGAHLFADAV